MALPYPNGSFDAAVMPLVIFFVPDPAKGVSEMARVVCPGGIVSAYGWDLLGGGFPYYPFQEELRAMGITVPEPPNPGASQIETMKAYWKGAGLTTIFTKEISVHRTFANFEEYWSIVQKGPAFIPVLATLSLKDIATLKVNLQARLVSDSSGRISCNALANAIYGRVKESASYVR